jgi:hypothetical protein
MSIEASLVILRHEADHQLQDILISWMNIQHAIPFEHEHELEEVLSFIKTSLINPQTDPMIVSHVLQVCHQLSLLEECIGKIVQENVIQIVFDFLLTNPLPGLISQAVLIFTNLARFPFAHPSLIAVGVLELASACITSLDSEEEEDLTVFIYSVLFICRIVGKQESGIAVDLVAENVLVSF